MVECGRKGVIHLMDWITFGIAVAGFLMSLATWVHTFLSQRRNVGIRITEFRADEKIALFFIHIENKSRLPIAITRIVLISNQEKVDCEPFPTWVLDSTHKIGKEIISQRSYYSMQMPIAISSLGAVSGYVLFQADQCMIPDDAKLANLQVYTNRGRSKILSIPLPSEN
nr:MAG TPA: hypothetical protein [Caudoviricetes sp.]DAW38987.1 MAG TPA: hypothetical protein [Caudoviricetes sp.]